MISNRKPSHSSAFDHHSDQSIGHSTGHSTVQNNLSGRRGIFGQNKNNQSGQTVAATAAHERNTSNPSQLYKRIPLRYNTHSRFLSGLVHSIASLLQSPPGLAVVLLSLALTLPAAIAMMSDSFSAAQQNLVENRHITVFLKPQLSNTDARQLTTTLAANEKVRSAVLAPTFLQSAEVMTIDIQPSSDLTQSHINTIVTELTSHPGIDYVDSDTMWMEQNINAVETTKKLATLTSVLASVLTGVLISILIYFDLTRQQSERVILNQMGASRSLLTRQLLIRSLLLTLMAIGAGILLAWGILFLLSNIGDMSSFSRILPVSLPEKQLLWLTIVAGLSCFASVKLLGKRI